MQHLHFESFHLSALTTTDTFVFFLPVKLLALNATVCSVPAAVVDGFTLTVVALQNYNSNSQCLQDRLEESHCYYRTFTIDINVKTKIIKMIFNSNKSPTRCNNFPVYYPDAYLQLNMFRAFSRPSSGAQ